MAKLEKIIAGLREQNAALTKGAENLEAGHAKEIKRLDGELAAERELLQQRIGQLNERLTAVTARADERAKSITALKEELAAVHHENARLSGYLDRVHEDDIVRELGPSVDPQPREPMSRRMALTAVQPGGWSRSSSASYGEKTFKWWER